MEELILDLFSGCGGFGLGAELAGFKSFAALDVDHVLQSSYKRNFPETLVLNEDIKNATSDFWNPIIGNVKIDGIIGGPPCQGFSRIGRRDLNDPRNSLVGHFYEQVKIVRPRFFVMENVVGILDGSAKLILSNAIEQVANNYSIIGPFVVNCADFGAATSRRRVIVIGFDKSQMGNLSLTDFDSVKRDSVNVRNAIGDIPSPAITGRDNYNKTDLGWDKYSSALSRNLSSYAKAMRKAPRSGLGSPEAIRQLTSKRVSGLHGTVHTPAVVERFSQVSAGKTDPVSRYPRLHWEGLCPTLRAGTGSDKGSYQAMRPIHPEEDRVISVREAARLQGFPDWFVFHPSKWHSFRMIGNSVSPLLSQSILSVIKKAL